MKFILIFLALVIPFASQAGELKLIINSSGFSGKTLFVAVHANADDFPSKDDNAIKRAVTATGDKTELTIADISPGEYAVSVFADLNGNGKLDTNLLGIPKEPIGATRDAQGRFGPPKFADAAFKVGNDLTTQTINIK